MRAFHTSLSGLALWALVACGGDAVSEGDDDGARNGRAEQSPGAGGESEASSGAPMAGSEGSAGSPGSDRSSGVTSVPGMAGGDSVGPSPVPSSTGTPVELGTGGAMGVAGSSAVTVLVSTGGGPIYVGSSGPVGRPVPIRGVVGTGVGVAGAGGIAGVEIPGVELPEDCAATYVSAGTDYCSIELQTGESDQYSCGCESTTGYLTIELTGLAGVEACAYVASLCAGSSTQIEFTEEAECVPQYEEVGSEWCMYEQECTQSAEIEEGVSVVSRQWQSTWCQLYDEAWTCSCDSAAANLTFDFPASAEAADVCPSAVDICAEGALALEGPRECSPTYQSASSDWCDRELDCTRTASVAGTEVLAHEWMYTSCRLAEESQWSCDCGIGTESMSFELSSADAWDTCQEASDMCVEALAVEQ
jgi:hypothetical protein